MTAPTRKSAEEQHALHQARARAALAVVHELRAVEPKPTGGQ